MTDTVPAPTPVPNQPGEPYIRDKWQGSYTEYLVVHGMFRGPSKTSREAAIQAHNELVAQIMPTTKPPTRIRIERRLRNTTAAYCH